MKKSKIAFAFVGIISIAFVLNLWANSANNDIIDRIHTELSSKDLNTIKKADSYIKEANGKLKEVEQEEEKFEKYFPKRARKGERKAVDAKILRIEASDLKTKANNAKYSVYKRKLESVPFEYPEDKARVDELIKDAEGSMNSSIKKIKAYIGVKKRELKKTQYARIQKDLAKVDELQQYAIDRLVESFEIWFLQEEKKMKELAEKEAWSKAESSNTISSYESYLTAYPYGPHAADANTRIRELKEKARLAAEEERRRLEAEAEKEAQTGIWFEVQVMAVTKQAKPEAVNKVYQGSEKVREFQQDGWFKYSVGKFEDYREARKYRRETGVKGAFVVAFKDETPISVREAKKIIKSSSASSSL